MRDTIEYIRDKLAGMGLDLDYHPVCSMVWDKHTDELFYRVYADTPEFMERKLLAFLSELV